MKGLTHHLGDKQEFNERSSHKTSNPKSELLLSYISFLLSTTHNGRLQFEDYIT